MEIKDFESDPGVPVGLTASMLHVTRGRVYQLLNEGRLERVPWDGGVGVSFASIKKRQRWLLKRQRK